MKRLYTIIIVVLFFLLITVMLSYYSTPSCKKESISAQKKEEKNFEKLKDISFSQFKNGKKIWSLTAYSMEDKGNIIVLNSVKGSGLTEKGKKFTFYIDKVILEKKTYSFSGSGNVKILYENKKIFGKKIEYYSQKNEYTIFHGIIYINNRLSFSGEKIYFLPDSTKVIVEGKNEG